MNPRSNRTAPPTPAASSSGDRAAEPAVADADLHAEEATPRERIRAERDHCGVGTRARIADELDAGLVVLTFGAAHRRLLAEDRREVREPQRGVGVRVALRDD